MWGGGGGEALLTAEAFWIAVANCFKDRREPIAQIDGSEFVPVHEGPCRVS